MGVEFDVRRIDLVGDLGLVEPDGPHRHRAEDVSELPVTLDTLAKVADFLRVAGLESAERAVLDDGVTVRRGQGFTLRVTTIPAVHRQLLARCQPLDGGLGVPAVPARRQCPPGVREPRRQSQPVIKIIPWPLLGFSTDPHPPADLRCESYRRVTCRLVAAR